VVEIWFRSFVKKILPYVYRVSCATALSVTRVDEAVLGIERRSTFSTLRLCEMRKKNNHAKSTGRNEFYRLGELISKLHPDEKGNDGTRAPPFTK